LPPERLEKLFGLLWPELKRDVENLPVADAPIQKPREPDELLREVLEVVRDTSRRANDFPSRDDLRAVVADVATFYLSPTTFGVTTRPTTWEEYEAILAIDKAKQKARQANEAAQVAVRELEEAKNIRAREAEETWRNAEERFKAMQDTEEADEHHDQD
jgi:hypothetical protein